LPFDVICSRLHNLLSVTDQSSRRAYYTTGIDRTDSGAVRFYDEKSRASVTLQSSEIVEISREAFDSGVRE
jgi:hypothetical protein